MQLIHNGIVLTLDENKRIIRDGAAVFDGETIVDVGERDGLLELYPNAEPIDAHGGIIMPGLVDLSIKSRCMLAAGADLASPGARLAFSKRLTIKDVRLSALAAAAECIRNGITTVFDSVFAPNDITGSLQMAASAYSESGVRACLGFEATPALGSARQHAMMEENREFIEFCGCRGDKSLAAMLAITGAGSLPTEALSELKRAAPSGGLCIPVSVNWESGEERPFASSPAARLGEAGLLGPKTILFGLPTLSEDDASLLAGSGAAAVFTPASRYSSLGAFAEPPLDEIDALLGTGGARPDLFEAARLARIIAGGDGAAKDAVSRALFRKNPAFAGSFFNSALGRLAPGSAADIIVLDRKPFFASDEEGLLEFLLDNAVGRDCTHTIVRGRVLMKDGRLIDIDEERLYKELAAAAERLQVRQEKRWNGK